MPGINLFMTLIIQKAKDLYSIILPKSCSSYMKVKYPDTYSTMTELPQELKKPDARKAMWCGGFFMDCTSLTEVPSLETELMREANNMFSDCKSLKKIGSVDLQNAYKVDSMFLGCSSLESVNILNADKGTIKNVSFMFRDCNKLTTLPDVIDLSNCTSNGMHMFKGCNSLTSVPDLKSTAKIDGMTGMFQDCKNLIEIPALDMSNNDTFNNIASGCVNLIKFNGPSKQVKPIKDMQYAFSGCNNITDIGYIDTNNVGNFNYAFAGCNKLKNIPWEIDMSSASTVNYMVTGCNSLSLSGIVLKNVDFQQLGITRGAGENDTLRGKLGGVAIGRVVILNTKGYSCYACNLNRLYAHMTDNVYNEDLFTKVDYTGFTSMSCFWINRGIKELPMLDTSTVTNMSSMCRNANSLIKAAPYDTSNVTDMNYIFSACFKLTELPKLNTSKVTNMDHAFDQCTSVTSIPEMDTSKVTDFDYAFNNMKSVKSIDWEIDMCSATTCVNMLGNNNLNNGGVRLKNVPKSLDLSNIGAPTSKYVIVNTI